MKRILALTILLSSLLFASPNTDSLLTVLKNAKGDEKVQALLELAQDNLYSDHELVKKYAFQALSDARRNSNPEQEVMALYYIGTVHVYNGDFQMAIDQYLQPARILAEELDYKKGYIAVMNSIAGAYMTIGKADQALESFQSILKMAQDSGQDDFVAGIQTNIASIYINQGNYNKAIAYLINSLNIYKKTNNKKMLSMVLNNIAIAYHSWGDWKKALEYYEKTLEIAADNDFSSAMPLNNIGEIYKENGEYDTALEYYSKANQLSRNANNQYFIAVTSLGIGEISQKMGILDRARQYTDLALELFTTIGFPEGIARSESNLAQINLDEGQNSTALSHAKASMTLAEELKLKDLLQTNYKLFSDINASSGNYRKALEYSRLYSAMKDTLHNENMNNEIARMQVNFETEQKEQENQLLRRQNTIQQIQIEKQKFRMYFLMSVALLVILIAGILFYINQIIRRNKKALEVRNQEIARKNEELTKAYQDLEKATKEVKVLSGLLPICASCKKIRDDKGYWNQIESYIRDHSEADFSHSICPECLERLYPDFSQKRKLASSQYPVNTETE